MAGTGASSTPSPYRVGVPIVGTHSRSEYDKELWDDLANVVYSTTEQDDENVGAGTSQIFCETNIPCPVKCRLEVHARVTPAYFPGVTITWSLHIRIDGVDFRSNPILSLGAGGVATYPAVIFGAEDADPGNHIIDIRVYSDTTHPFGSKELMIRRGRTPPS